MVFVTVDEDRVQLNNLTGSVIQAFPGSVIYQYSKLQMDDPIYVTTLWQTLTYRVCEIRIVTPSDNTWCKIQEGRTLISLMTCHPYGQNYQRYVVFAELCREDAVRPPAGGFLCPKRRFSPAEGDCCR